MPSTSENSVKDSTATWGTQPLDRRWLRLLVQRGFPLRHLRNRSWWLKFPQETRQDMLQTLAQRKGLYLWGPSGVGKTTAATQLVYEYGVSRHWRRLPEARYVNYPELIDFAGGSFSEEQWQAAMTAQLLVLDDLGAERQTDWTQSRLYLVLDKFYREERLLVVTSQYSLDGYISKLRQTEPELADRIYTRLHSTVRPIMLREA